MSSPNLKNRLLEQIGNLPVIDAHEHLMPEKHRIGDDVDACDLFCHYNVADLRSAGMTDAEWRILFNTNAHDARRKPDDQPFDARWNILKKYLPFVRHTGYGRAVFITLRDIYGADDLNDANVQEVSAKMRETYAEDGLYKRLLVERCNIVKILNQGFSPRTHAGLLEDRMETNGGLMVNVLIEQLVLPTAMGGPEDFHKTHDEQLPASIPDLKDWLKQRCRKWRKESVVGFKMVPHAGLPKRSPDHKETDALYAGFAAGSRLDDAETSALHLSLRHLLCDVAAEEDMVVAVHLGYIAGTWGDFRTTDPRHWMSMLLAHKETRFDLYHAGIPWPRVVGVIGKQFPNAWLNLCWCAVMSPRMTARTLDEWLDIVPVNKIAAFGGDYGRPVENVYGHLVLARQIVSEVLADRVERGEMGEDRALEIARLWFHDNSKVLYRL